MVSVDQVPQTCPSENGKNLFLTGTQKIEKIFQFFSRLVSQQGRIHGSISRGGWAGAVMCWAGAMGGPVYTTASVTCDWAGAEVQKPLAKEMVTDGWTDGRTEKNQSQSIGLEQ